MLQKHAGRKIQIKIKEIKRPETHAQVVALNIARQLRTRASFRRTLKMALNSANKAGVQGIRIKISGRLGGAEMSRTETVRSGRVPLHTLRADIDYGMAQAFSSFGVIGVKVWIFHGEVYGTEAKDDAGALLGKRKGESRS